MTDNVIGFDDYVKDFERLALPEYKYLAEIKLVDSIETREEHEQLLIKLESDLTVVGLNFYFAFIKDIESDDFLYIGYT